MAMTLTVEDLTAIARIVENTVQPMIDALAHNKVAGLAATHVKADHIQFDLHSAKTMVERIERAQRAEIEPADVPPPSIYKQLKPE